MPININHAVIMYAQFACRSAVAMRLAARWLKAKPAVIGLNQLM